MTPAQFNSGFDLYSSRDYLFGPRQTRAGSICSAQDKLGPRLGSINQMLKGAFENRWFSFACMMDCFGRQTLVGDRTHLGLRTRLGQLIGESYRFPMLGEPIPIASA